MCMKIVVFPPATPLNERNLEKKCRLPTVLFCYRVLCFTFVPSATEVSVITPPTVVLHVSIWIFEKRSQKVLKIS